MKPSGGINWLPHRTLTRNEVSLEKYRLADDCHAGALSRLDVESACWSLSNAR
jgi:hypothetical protein